MSPRPINRRGPPRSNPASQWQKIDIAAVILSPQSERTDSTPSGTRNPSRTPVTNVGYNTLTAESIIATWKVKRTPPKIFDDEPEQNVNEINTKAKRNVQNETVTAKTPNTVSNVKTLETKNTKEVAVEEKFEQNVQNKTVIQSIVTNVKTSTYEAKNTKEVTAEEEIQQNQVRSAISIFEKNAGKQPLQQQEKRQFELPKKQPEKEVITLSTVKVASKPTAAENVSKEEKNAKKSGEKIVVPIRKPAINVSVQPWKSEGADKEIRSVKPLRNEVFTAITQERKTNESTKTTTETTVSTPSPKTNDDETIIRTSEKTSSSQSQQSDVIDNRQSLSFDTDSSARSSLNHQLDFNHPRAIDLVKKDSRTYWKDIPAVQDSGILDKLNKDERIRQEAKFEVMFSEASYLNSLNLLKSHYMNNIKKHIPQILKTEDYNELFSHVLDVRKCSEDFLKELNDHWQEDLMLDKIYEIVSRYSAEEFKIYVKYCRRMLEMQKKLTELTDNNEEFKSLLEVLINRQGSQKLSLNSFLTSPMQRITKFPLLMKTILDKLESGTEEYDQCNQAYEATSKIANECNTVVDENQKLEELLLLSQQIDFPSDSRSIPIVTPNRYVVAKADVKHLAFTANSTKKEKLKLILFNDLLLVAKKKSEKQFIVVDHCPRNNVIAKEMENLHLYGHPDLKNPNKNPIIITMLCNSENKKTDLMVIFKDPDSRKEWLQYLSQESAVDEDDSVQVIVLQEHTASSTDELNLSPGDVIHVIEEEVDGWCQGELLSDGSKGKFPISKTAKITSPKIKAANAKTRKDLRQSQIIDE